jgi:hypothetical protein
MSLLRRNIVSITTQSTLISSRSFISTQSIRTMASQTSQQVHRMTLFKIADSKDVQAVLDKYATLAQDAKKVCTGSNASYSTID